jgi:hypothetical protein
MSREAGRTRALLNAARLRHVLEARERVELLGCAIVPVEDVGEAPTDTVQPRVRRTTMSGREAPRHDA